MKLSVGHTVRLVSDQKKLMFDCISVKSELLDNGVYRVYEKGPTFCIVEQITRKYSVIDSDTLEVVKGDIKMGTYLKHFLLKLSGVRGATINEVLFSIPIKEHVGKAIYDGEGFIFNMYEEG